MDVFRRVFYCEKLKGDGEHNIARILQTQKFYVFYKAAEFVRF